MLIFPIVVIHFFTSMLDEGQPTELPVGVVDMDNTSTSRALIRRVDAFQTSHIVARYNNASEAREAMQRGEIYAFLLIPHNMTANLGSSRQPKVSFYYNGVYMLAGSSTFRDLKTATTLVGAGVGMQKLAAIGKSNREIKAFLMPVNIDLHMIGNPWANYNIYLTTTMVPGILILFIFLVTPYSLGTELKFGRAHQWIEAAGGNMWIALLGKFLPHTMVWLTIFYGFELYIYNVLGFPHPGGAWPILLLGLLTVLAAQGFGVFIFGIMPSLRMSLSVCSLCGMLGFSLCGATFPLFAMDSPIQAISWIAPLRHYYVIYQTCIFNNFPLSAARWHIAVLIIFSLLPLFVVSKMKKVMLEFEYIP